MPAAGAGVQVVGSVGRADHVQPESAGPVCWSGGGSRLTPSPVNFLFPFPHFPFPFPAIPHYWVPVPLPVTSTGVGIHQRKNPGVFPPGCVFQVVRPCGLKRLLRRHLPPTNPHPTTNDGIPWRSVLLRWPPPKGPGGFPPGGPVVLGGRMRRCETKCAWSFLPPVWVLLSVNFYPGRGASPGLIPGAAPNPVKCSFNPLQCLQLPGVDEISAVLVGVAF